MLTKNENMSLLGFVPALVVQYLANQQQITQLPEKQNLRSVVMFADISGFTNLTETLSKLGNEGAELIAFAINRYMELLVSAISKSGGDIFKFAGDAMIVVWPPSIKESAVENHEELKVICRLAVQSALDIQSKLNNTTILEDIKLSVKIGFGIGDINIIYVGGVFGRSEYLATGDPLTQAFKSEHHATSGGQIIVSQEVFDMVSDFFVFQRLQNDSSFYMVVKLINNKVQLKAGAQLIKNRLGGINKQQIMTFIPAALIPYIEIEQEKWSSELRRITTLFINLGIDLSDADSRLQHIQKVIEVVQKCIYINEGSLNKLLMDDKGSTLIVGFGLPPLKHQDDPIRALLAAQLLVKQLSLINCKCYIGVATGIVFTGVVGTSGSRREYSILGDAVNLAARLMQLAIIENKSILLCQKTAEDCEHKIDSELFKMVQLKGKTGLIPVYQITQQKSILKIHYYESKMGFNYKGLVGGKDKTQQILHIVNTFLMMDREGRISLADMDIERDFILLKGSYGVGKTFVMKILEYQIKTENPKVLILESSINSFEKIFKGNGFKKIIKQIFDIALSKTTYSQQELLVLISNGNKIIQKLLEELMDLNEWLNEYVNNFPNFQSNTNEEQMMKLIGQGIVKLFEIYFEQQLPDKKRRLYSQMMDDESDDVNSNDLSSDKVDVPPIIIILDDFQYYDQLSFYLIKTIIKKFNRILIIGITRDQFWEIPIMSRKGNSRNPNRSQELIYDKGVESIINLYNVTPNEVIMKGIKNIEEQKHFLLLYFGFDKFSDPNIHQILHLKSCRQPLLLIHLVKTLLDNKYLIKENDSVYATQQLQTLFQHEEWLQIEIPQICYQMNGPIIDSLSCINLLLLKFACVIGDIFDIQTLFKIIPFKQINQNKLLMSLKQLVQQDIIEFMHDDNENRYYRFVTPFMRECLYQSMTYTQRRSIHSLVAEALQIIPQPYEDYKELKRLEYHLKMAEQKISIKSSNAIIKFSHKAKKSLIVKQIQMILKTDNNMKVPLKKGFIFKRSDKKVSWQYRYCVIDSENMILYLNNQMSEQTGILPLKLITTIIPIFDKSDDQQQFCLQVGVSDWIKKGKVKGDKRVFLFAFESEDSLEEWTIFLEFVKAKSIYNDFVENFGRIQLPINLINEAYDPQLTIYLQEMFKGSIKRFRQQNVTEQLSNKNRKSTHSKPQQLQIVQSPIPTYHSPNNNPKRFSVRFSAISEQEEKSDDTPLKEKLRQFFFGSFAVLAIHLLTHIDETNYIVLGQEGRTMRRLNKNKKHKNNMMQRIPNIPSIIEFDFQ
ncbi:unnamed protein product [Paramecium primaurelia]|uniref:Adenylate cyclase n=1 Tax=Paramecium primaurelia TaxID=5886 RepID=A0A8S1N0I6_PARPR|nr:unnamed protein product [Paramecium primaurelia]